MINKKFYCNLWFEFSVEHFMILKVLHLLAKSPFHFYKTSKSRQACNMEEDKAEMMGENDMKIDNERDEDEGDSNSEGEDSSEDEEEGSGIKKKKEEAAGSKEDKRPDNVSGRRNSEEDVGSRFSGEFKMRETFEAELYFSEKKRKGETKEAHAECKINDCVGCDKLKESPTTKNIEDHIAIDHDVGQDMDKDNGLSGNMDFNNNTFNQTINITVSGEVGHFV